MRIPRFAGPVHTSREGLESWLPACPAHHSTAPCRVRRPWGMLDAVGVLRGRCFVSRPAQSGLVRVARRHMRLTNVLAPGLSDSSPSTNPTVAVGSTRLKPIRPRSRDTDEGFTIVAVSVTTNLSALTFIVVKVSMVTSPSLFIPWRLKGTAPSEMSVTLVLCGSVGWLNRRRELGARMTRHKCIDGTVAVAYA